ncbi:MAG: RNA polymerase factor sigma-54 [Pseudomonadota bacterium]
MGISQKLDLKQGQQLVMTPQLQQAIKLLQLTNLELTEFVESQLEENPFLERDESAQAPERGERQREETRTDGEASADPSTLDTDYSNIDTEATRADMPAGEAGAGDWSSVSSRAAPLSDEYDPTAQMSEEKSLHDHLTEQLHVSTRDEMMLLVGAHLIDLIDDGGYLREEVADIALRLGADDSLVKKALKLIQGFEPSGVGARSLQECLQLQLKDNGELTADMDLFLEHIHFLGTHNLPALRRACRFSEDDLKTHIDAIRQLNPKPGLQYGRDFVQTVVPDVHVTESDDGGWKVELNAETLPKIIANERYFAKLSASSATSERETKSFLNEQMSNANWLIKSLDQRARTILKVSTEIVKVQDEFFVKGIQYLRPLNLKTIADAIEMHESTVSRVTSNKYIHTPRGTFELKYFFTPAIAARHGEAQYSAESIRHRIKSLIDDEDPTSPHSDDKLVALLADENVDIARRTVAKYREALGIASSVQRRRQAKRALG